MKLGGSRSDERFIIFGELIRIASETPHSQTKIVAVLDVLHSQIFDRRGESDLKRNLRKGALRGGIDG